MTWSVRGLDGKVLRQWVETGSQGEGGNTWRWAQDYVYRDGQLLAAEQLSGETHHFHLDHLGTPRLITRGDGSEVARHTYFPFGDEVTDPSQDDERMKFTGHERDRHEVVPAGGEGEPASEDPDDDLDYMHARHYSPFLGRFLSVDPIDSGFSGNPQSWNKYTYGLDNPLKYVDRNGQAAELVLGVPIAGTAAGTSSTVLIGTGPGLFVAAAIGIPIGYAVNQIPGVSEALTDPAISDFLSDVLFAEDASAPEGQNESPEESTEEGNHNQDKILSKGEIKKLKESGFDPEELKGGKRTGKTDLYKDKKGNIYVKPKGGSGPGEDLGININDIVIRPPFPW